MEFQDTFMYFLPEAETKALLVGSLNRQHFVERHADLQTLEPHVDPNAPPMLNMSLTYMPDGDKDMKVTFQNLKLFMRPYYYLMVHHFFSEAMPQYDMTSFDCPHLWDSNYETYPSLFMRVDFADCVMCMATSFDDTGRAVAIEVENCVYLFQRMKIGQQKKLIVDKVQATRAQRNRGSQHLNINVTETFTESEIPKANSDVKGLEQLDEGEEEDESTVQMPITCVSLEALQMHPFFCNLEDFETTELRSIVKR